MEGKGRSSRLFSLIIAVLVLEEFCTVSESAQAPAMFIFGDSLSDNGNNNYLPSIARANYPPFGIDSGGVPTGRFCNGLLGVDYAAKFMGLKCPPPYLSLSAQTKLILRGANYASAAAGILDESGRNYGIRVPLKRQIALFNSTVRIQLPLLIQNQEELSKFIADSVFIVNIGTNDYLNNYLMPLLYSSSSVYSSEAFGKLLVDKLSQHLQTLYKLGARKFLVAGLGPIGCTPSIMAKNSTNTGECDESVNSLILTYNSYLMPLISIINSTLPDSYFVYEDVYPTFYDMVKNPSNYGFNVSNKACCGNGRHGGKLTCMPFQPPCTARDKYIFWDSFHPTQAVFEKLMARCFGENATDCQPMSGTMLAQV